MLAVGRSVMRRRAVGGTKAWSKGSFVSRFRFGEVSVVVGRGVDVSILVLMLLRECATAAGRFDNSDRKRTIA